MLLKKIIFVTIGLTILAFMIVGLLRLAHHPTLEDSRATMDNKLSILLNNLAGSIAPERTPPISTLDLEESLRTYVPTPFTRFTEDDWTWFWQLMYKRVEEDTDSWPRRKRQLAREEIQEILMNYYPRPFSSFKDQQWASFWKFVLKGRIFK